MVEGSALRFTNEIEGAPRSPGQQPSQPHYVDAPVPLAVAVFFTARRFLDTASDRSPPPIFAREKRYRLPMQRSLA